jgi:ATP/maltotriose-dependent transcriptional regulator MalT
MEPASTKRREPQRARASSRAGPGLLLVTKLHAPASSRDLVPRRILLERLAAERTHKLTLVAAPAGWGKTTLLAAWKRSEERKRPFAWLSLDREDNDPVRFWRYVVEALLTAEPDIGTTALRLLRAPGTGLLETVMPALISDADTLSREVVLVLDDYHVIESAEIHESVEFLLEHLPRFLRLVLATRSDPPLPLARLRVRGELVELRADELRFGEEECDLFLNGLLGLGLDGSDIARLRERTEGWAAGLYLAALSLRGRIDAHEFIAAFAGNDRHVVDYLVTEVLDREPADVRTFLLRTSILDRVSGPLCDSVLETEGSRERLVQLERSNLFLVPLDTTRDWYRYHHLFAELLRHELRQKEFALVRTLHRRASAWYRQHGFASDAIHHALAADDLSAASDLIALHWNDFVNQGQLETVAGWLDTLSDDVVARDARLCIARAGICLLLGRRDRVERWLDAAEGAPVPRPVRFGAASIEAEAEIYRAVNRFMTGDVSGALAPATRAVELERADPSPWQAMAWAALGRTLFWHRKHDEARAALEEAARRSDPASNNWSVFGALGYLACIRVEQQDFEAARSLCDRALGLAEEHGLQEHWVAAMALVARGKVREQSGDLDAAEDAIARAVELSRRGATRVELIYALVALAEAQQLRGDRTATASLLREARHYAADSPDAEALHDLVRRGERRLGLARRRHDVPEELSPRELAVLRLLPGERSLREIGASLYLSYNTVKTHTRAIYRKLDASTRGEAVTRARELGLL